MYTIIFATEDDNVIVGYCEDPDLTKEICKTKGLYAEYTTPMIKSKDDIYYCYEKSFTFDSSEYLTYLAKANYTTYRPSKLSSLSLDKKELDTKLVGVHSMSKYNRNRFNIFDVYQDNLLVISTSILINTPDPELADKELTEFMDKYLNRYSDFNIESLCEFAKKMSEENPIQNKEIPSDTVEEEKTNDTAIDNKGLTEIFVLSDRESNEAVGFCYGAKEAATMIANYDESLEFYSIPRYDLLVNMADEENGELKEPYCSYDIRIIYKSNIVQRDKRIDNYTSVKEKYYLVEKVICHQLQDTFFSIEPTGLAKSDTIISFDDCCMTIRVHNLKYSDNNGDIAMSKARDIFDEFTKKYDNYIYIDYVNEFNQIYRNMAIEPDENKRKQELELMKKLNEKYKSLK